MGIPFRTSDSLIQAAGDRGFITHRARFVVTLSDGTRLWSDVYQLDSGTRVIKRNKKQS